MCHSLKMKKHNMMDLYVIVYMKIGSLPGERWGSVPGNG